MLSCLTLAAPIPAPLAAASGSLQLVGRGWGHGVGLSQWGAYGYAVDFGWSAGQILDHYYGNTVAGTTDNPSIAVRMLLHDDRQTAVVNDLGTLVVDGVSGGPWKSVVARESTQGVYTVWGRSDVVACPDQSVVLSAAAGWTIVASAVGPSVTIRTATDTTSTTSYAALPALCEPDGKVRSYRGIIRAVNGTDGENRTVTEVPLEQYLRSVVAKEMSASWANAGGGRGAQALQAQAVAARSYALAEDRYSYARTCDLQYCQAYLGAAVRSGLSSGYTAVEHPLIDAAVTATVGQVRRVGSTTGPIAYAMFSASSGGYTAPTALGYPARPDLGDATAGNPSNNWSVSIPLDTVQAAFPSIGTFTALVVVSRNGLGDLGGRVLLTRVEGSSGSVTVTGDQLRTKLGLKSNWFAVGGTTAALPPNTPNPGSDPCLGRMPPPTSPVAQPATAARFTAVSPVRLVDTRLGFGTADAPLGAGCTLVLHPQVDPSATAVALNLTSVTPDQSGFVTAYPCGVERPETSLIQALAGRVVAGMAIVPLGAGGNVCVYSRFATEIVVDLFGYYRPGVGDRFEPVAPVRRYDSRSGFARLAAGTIVRVPIVGQGAAPAGATAAALTIHALNATAPGFATVYPCSAEVPIVSSVNVLTGDNVTNHVEVALDTNGDVCIYVLTAMHLAVDLSGWYGPTATTEFYALTPNRVMDTRVNQGLPGAFVANRPRAIAMAGAGGVTTGVTAKAIVAEVTVVGPQSTGWATVYPCQATPPDLSMVRYTANGNSAAAVTGIVDGAGSWCVVTNKPADLLIDVAGYFG